MIRLGFYLPRDTHLKIIGPVVDYLLADRSREFEVVIVVADWRIRKADLQSRLDYLGQLWGTRVRIERVADVEAVRGLIRSRAIDAFVNVSPAVLEISSAEVAMLRAESTKAGVRWLALPYVFSQDYQIVKNAESIAETWDVVCTLGDRSRRYVESQIQQLAPDIARAIRDRLVITGSTELDALQAMPDAQALKRKYGLPEDRPVVYVSTAPALYPSVSTSPVVRGLSSRFRGRFERSPGGWLARAVSYTRYPTLVSYREYLAALRAFADANGAVLIGKTREKHDDPPYVHEYLDVLFGDRCFHPFTTLELLRLSDVYFGFFSASVIEATSAGAYAISTLFFPPDTFEPPSPAYRQWSEDMLWGADGFWNQRGVSEVIDGTRLSTRTVLRQLASASLADYAVDRSRRAEVLSAFVAHMGASSARFADAAAAVCA